ncbi:MAG TPA: hypothetical protein VGP07_05380 [Polyangia bacterium]
MLVVSLAVGLGGSCGLRGDIIEPPPYDGGQVGEVGGDCTQRPDDALGCVISSLSCDTASHCPATWADAQAQQSCQGLGSVTLESCADTYRWTYVRGESISWCYYAMNGVLQGIEEESDDVRYCGGASGQGVYGIVPQGCHDDAGTSSSSITCQDADASSGN